MELIIESLYYLASCIGFLFMLVIMFFGLGFIAIFINEYLKFKNNE